MITIIEKVGSGREVDAINVGTAIAAVIKRRTQSIPDGALLGDSPVRLL
jgi:hypothetical protein